MTCCFTQTAPHAFDYRITPPPVKVQDMYGLTSDTATPSRDEGIALIGRGRGGDLCDALQPGQFPFILSGVKVGDPALDA